MSRFDYVFSRRYSPAISLTRYDEEQDKMSAKDRRKQSETSGLLKFMAVLAIISSIGVVGTYFDTQSRIAHHQPTIKLAGK